MAGSGEALPTFKKDESSPFFSRFSHSCNACFRFCPFIASCICLFLRSITALEAMVKNVGDTG